MDEERQAVFQNMEDDIIRMMQPHRTYVTLVEQGRTPFRSTLHMISTLMSDAISLTLTAEEQALKETLLEVAKMKDVHLFPFSNTRNTATG